MVRRLTLVPSLVLAAWNRVPCQRASAIGASPAVSSDRAPGDRAEIAILRRSKKSSAGDSSVCIARLGGSPSCSAAANDAAPTLPPDTPITANRLS